MVQHINPLLTPSQHPMTPIHGQPPDIRLHPLEVTTPVEVDFTIMFITDIKQLAQPNATSCIIPHIEDILHG